MARRCDDPDAAAKGGLLDWWYDGGKQVVPLALDTPEGANQPIVGSPRPPI